MAFITIFLLTAIDIQAQWISKGAPFTEVQSYSVIGNNLFVGTQNSGIYVSSDNATTWSAANTGLTSTNVSSLTTNGSNFFAGMYGEGVFLSTNNGGSWTAVNTGLTNPYVKALLAVGSNLFAGTEGCLGCNGGGVFISSDNGASWNEANNGITDTYIHFLVVIGNNIFAGSPGGGVFRSSDNGASWTAVNNGLDIRINSLVASGNNLLAGTQGGAFLSTDNGDTWVVINTYLTDNYGSPGFYPIVNVAASGGYSFASTFANLFFSTNNGSTWGTAGLDNLDVRYVFEYNGTAFASTFSNALYAQPLSNFPTITSVQPSAGIIGSTVTINGSGFSTTPSDNEVILGLTNTVATASTTNSLTFVVPAEATTGPISVIVNGEKTTTSSHFTIIPNITSFYPASAPIGSSVTIVGTGFLENLLSDSVFFNGMLGKIYGTTDNTISVTVPQGAASGPIEVLVGGQIAPGVNNFIVLPAITSFTPGSGTSGTTLTINGTSFSPVASENSVTINGVAAIVTSSSSTSITVIVPPAASTGPISVTVDGNTATTTPLDNFTVIPIIISLTPSSGVIGTLVTIAGTGFNSVISKNVVTVDGITATVVSASGTSLSFVIPANASNGLVSVSTGGRTVTNYFIVDPTITSFAPLAGYAGSSVTITGTGFSLAFGDSVRFNGTNAFVDVINSTTLIALVPQLATSGSLSISRGVKRATSSTTFTVFILPAPVAEPAVDITSGGFTARWRSVPQAIGYQLDVSTDNFQSFLKGYQSKFETDTIDNVTGAPPGTALQYRVRSFNQYTASLNSNIISSVVTGIPSHEHDIPYPNPAHDRIFVSSNDNLVVSSNAINLIGQSTPLQFIQSNNLVECDVSNLSNGIYILQLIEGTQTVRYKFIKQ